MPKKTGCGCKDLSHAASVVALIFAEIKSACGGLTFFETYFYRPPFDVFFYNG